MPDNWLHPVSESALRCIYSSPASQLYFASQNHEHQGRNKGVVIEPQKMELISAYGRTILVQKPSKHPCNSH